MHKRVKPIVAEPDQHYWRRKANRRVRKARLTRTLRRWSLTAVPGQIAGSSDRAVRGGADSIRNRFASYVGKNIVDVNLYEVAAVAKSDPWVLDASAKRILPRTLRVTVTERFPAAVAVIDGAGYVVDTTGYVVGPKKRGEFEIREEAVSRIMAPSVLRDGPSTR